MFMQCPDWIYVFLRNEDIQKPQEQKKSVKYIKYFQPSTAPAGTSQHLPFVWEHCVVPNEQKEIASSVLGPVTPCSWDFDVGGRAECIGLGRLVKKKKNCQVNSNCKSLCWISVCSGIHKQKANQSSKHFSGQLSCRERTVSIQYAQKESVFVQRQLQPSWRGNAAVFTVGIVTMESCELLQNVCAVMDGKYDLATPGPGWVSCHSWPSDRYLLTLGTLSQAQLGFLSDPFYSLGGVGLACACIQSDGVCDPSVQAVHLLCSCNVLLVLKSIMPNL